MISICVLTHNNMDLVKRCIDSVEDHTSTPYEIIVVDNASENMTLLDNYEYDGRINLFRNYENVGSPKGMNQAVSHAKGDIIVTLDSDAEVVDKWDQVMLKCFDDNVAMVGAYTDNGVYGKQAEWSGQDSPVDVSELVQFCAMIRKSVWDEIGGWDEDFGKGYFEDTYFSYLVNRAGYRQVLAPIFIPHHGGATLGYGKEFNDLMFRNHATFQRKIGNRVIEAQFVIESGAEPKVITLDVSKAKDRCSYYIRKSIKK